MICGWTTCCSSSKINPCKTRSGCLRHTWIITQENERALSLDHGIECRAGTLWTSDPAAIQNYPFGETGLSILVDGYVLPRLHCHESCKRFRHADLVFQLFKIYRFDFIKHVKGLFIIVLAVDGRFHIYSDHLGVYKLFYANAGSGKVSVSNAMKPLAKMIRPEISGDNLALNILFNHFIEGRTPFKNIRFSGTGALMTIGENDFKIATHWKPYDCLNGRDGSFDRIEKIGTFFKYLVASYVEYFSPETISIPATGGLDCRTILAALLADGREPETYTYGNADSADANYGRLLAEALRLRHTQYRPPDNLPDWFDRMADLITEKGNAITSIHRAHRLHAVRKEAKKCDLMFLGYLGGETVRGNWPDNLITSPFILKVWRGIENYETEVSNHLGLNYFKPECCDLKKIEHLIRTLDFVGDPTNINQFHFLFRLKAHIHFAQDLNLFVNDVKQVIPIFMDIDYLEMIFNTKFNLLYKQNLTKNIIKRIHAPTFSCAIIEFLHKGIARIPLSQCFSPVEYNISRYMAAAKGQIRKRKNKKFTANFNYQFWYKEFFLSKASFSETVQYFYNSNDAINNMQKGSFKIIDEKSCLPFSRLIELSKLLQYYSIRK